MVSQDEIRNLIEMAREKGAEIEVIFEGDALIFEGREIIEQVQVTGGAKGIGPGPMEVINAAERLRGFVYGQ